MESRPQIFALIGPESTGKTTLAIQLAAHLKGTMVPEFARQYLEERAGAYSESDLVEIARGQIGSEERILKITTHGPVICDTDILVIMVWYRFKYGKTNDEIESLLKLQRPHKYLLTYPDLAWEPDPIRENPDDLLELFNLYETELQSLGVEYRVISGIGEARLANAIQAINEMKLD